NRSQLKKTEDNTLIIDAYNANPTSMMAALQNFRNMTVPHKMLILGDMRELGAEGPAEHQKIVDYIKESDFEKVWLVGEQFAAREHSFKTYANVQEVIKDLQEDKPKGYTILIKGSNGIKLSSTVEFL
ncbi:MAG: UDP-N-acetylmuramoyl-tripeptide--D-alanyl-D-alanine ligase, partial [Bacteroides sp.]|nr:UDP-N-acetylmuramoyl-tripeptide--D-alanyl-D-alanine ligase [Bacteroides sp.]